LIGIDKREINNMLMAKFRLLQVRGGLPMVSCQKPIPWLKSSLPIVLLKCSFVTIFTQVNIWLFPKTLFLFIKYTSPWRGFELTTLVVIGTDCISSYKSNYHTITTTTAPHILNECTRVWFFHYVIKFVSDLRQVIVFLWVLRFLPPIKLTATI
jgi:hypothetical protein